MKNLIKKVKNYLLSKVSLRESLQDLIVQRPKNSKGDYFEFQILKNIYAMMDKDAEDIMTHRADIIALDESSSLEDLKKLLKDEGMSRIPIYKDTLDNIVGFVHNKDVWKVAKDDMIIADIKRNIFFVSQHAKPLDVLYEMRVNQTHICIVLDDFSGVYGLVTMEDIMEELVGEIEDEHDDAIADIKKINQDKFEVQGSVEIEEIEKIFNINLQDEEKEHKTVAGLILDLTSYIPKPGEVINHPSGLVFKILSSDNMRIKNVIIEYKK